MTPVVVYRGRTKVLPVKLSYDVSADTFTSQIRKGRRPTTDLIATWNVDLATDGSDGKLILTLDDGVTSLITDDIGYMDIKRVGADGEPVPVFDGVLQVNFRDLPTA